jgi:hypothetical protein
MQISFCIRIYSVILALLLSQGVMAAEKQTTVRSPVISVGVPGPTNGDFVAITEEMKVKRAWFNAEPASASARQVADWVVNSGDNSRRPFVIIDKVDAKVYVFNSFGNLLRAAPALLGLAEGDSDEPGIGALPLSGIRPELRTTPAGRFVAQIGHNLKGQDILWIDYAAGISMHRVVTSNKLENRQLRLDSPTPLDNRISFGCINVPVAFFEQVVAPAFAGKSGIVYILPETLSASEVFGSYAVDAL